MSVIKEIDTFSMDQIPRHVAIIMDGNGRWADRQGKTRIYGHRAGIQAAYKTINFSIKFGLQALTLYAFSRDNWRRPEQEVTALLGLLMQALENQFLELKDKNVCLRVIGDKTVFSQQLQDHIAHAESITANNSGLRLTIAANYSGRWDIMQAVRQLMYAMSNDHASCEHIDEKLLESYLSLHDLPEVDLVIRTSGEYRISNFLLWQIAYAELYFTEILWPDFDENSFLLALQDFSKRERRFGKVTAINLSTWEN